MSNRRLPRQALIQKYEPLVFSFDIRGMSGLIVRTGTNVTNEHIKRSGFAKGWYNPNSRLGY